MNGKRVTKRIFEREKKVNGILKGNILFRPNLIGNGKGGLKLGVMICRSFQAITKNKKTQKQGHSGIQTHAMPFTNTSQPSNQMLYTVRYQG